tara:strand:- start:349 stop:1701 length:1353 start_codon:yes stop_codon:yes gene_type:complete
MKKLILLILFVPLISFSQGECKTIKNLLRDKNNGIEVFSSINSIKICYDSSWPRGWGYVQIDYNSNFSNTPGEIMEKRISGGTTTIIFDFVDNRIKLDYSPSMNIVVLTQIDGSYEQYRIMTVAEIVKRKIKIAERDRKREEEKRTKQLADSLKIDEYTKSTASLIAVEKLESLDKLTSSLNYQYPKLDRLKESILLEIDRINIEGYRVASLNLSSTEKLEKLNELISLLNNESLEINKERDDLNYVIEESKIIQLLKNKEYEKAQKLASNIKIRSTEFLYKIYPHVKIYEKILKDIKDLNEFTNDQRELKRYTAANLYALRWMLTYSNIEIVDAKWYKGSGGGKLILTGSNGKLYGGMRGFWPGGMVFLLNKNVDRKKLPKIKTNQLYYFDTNPMMKEFVTVNLSSLKPETSNSAFNEFNIQLVESENTKNLARNFYEKRYKGISKYFK